MDPELVLFCVLLIVFLAIVAYIYIVRPEIFIITDEEGYVDIDMWKAFVFALLVAVLTVLATGYCVLKSLCM
jgi:hypothetical protein